MCLMMIGARPFGVLDIFCTAHTCRQEFESTDG